ncbi:ExbD/TolR family protein [Xanthomonas campestris]|uniref:ExbD/TolR family protein n=1 Tax=Xanthomonas campestris TaxID=339 RepID=UPI00224C4795|nr:biopolymer transporter ExbD [Xanthomonas campestris]
MVTRTITLDLPQATNQPRVPLEPPAPIALRLDAEGQVFWNASPVSLQALQPRLTDTMRETAGNQPELRIAANQDAEYAVLAKVLAAAKSAQVQRIAFVQ